MRKLIIPVIFIVFILINCFTYKTYDFNRDKTIQVEIKGEVINPKVFETKLGSTFSDLIEQIEFNDEADIENLPLLEVLHDKQIITIPKKNTSNLTSINMASLSELAFLPGIGKSIAKNIVDYRQENGSFINLEDLKNVNGIGEKKFEKIKSYICL